ncbi:50S ribosomal protein L5 [Candidatus Woesearchaeota archaeon]|nr:50S ribosomal protein L5 [Candidatus Woesearchaeota archaeon]
MNPNKTIKVGKLTLNIGTGKEPAKLEKGLKLLQKISGAKPVKTFTTKRIQAWGVRPGLPIGCKVTLRGATVLPLIKRLLQSKENMLSESNVDLNGNVSFGIPEYIDIPGMEYDPDIKIMGLEASITLVRNGFRVKERRLQQKRLPGDHRIGQKEAIEFLKQQFSVRFEEQEEE